MYRIFLFLNRVANNKFVWYFAGMADLALIVGAVYVIRHLRWV